MAGQAGLTVSYYLQAFGVEYVILERDRIAESWRSARWDSFTLVTPHWTTRLPGCALAPGSGRDFLPRHSVVAMLERFGRGTRGAAGYQPGAPGPTPLEQAPHGGGGAGDAIPLAPVRSGVERSLADSILVSGGYRQHELAAGAMLSDLPISPADVHVLLDGLLLFEFDGRPVLDAGPGAIFDPAMRMPESKQHVTVRAKTRCRLAVIPRDQLDSQALLGVAAQQTGRLQDQVS